MLNAITFFIALLLVTNVFAQNSEWGIRVAPAFSKARKARGFDTVYPGAPFWSGNLQITEKQVTGIAFQVYREKPTRFKKVSLNTSVGFLSCGAFRHYSYDYENSVNNIISVQKRFHYVTAGALAKWNFGTGKWKPFIGIGPHAGLIIRSRETSINWVNNQQRREGSYNFLSKERKANFGAQYSIGASSRKVKLDIFFQSYYRMHYNHFGKRICAYGLGMSYLFVQKK